MDRRPLAASVDFREADGRDVALQERLLEADRDWVLSLIAYAPASPPWPRCDNAHLSEGAYRVAKGGSHVAFGC